MIGAEKPQPDAPKPKKRKRRWFQFSLRSLLIATLMCAVACGWLGKKIEQKRNERAAFQAIARLGGGMQYDYQLGGSGGTPHGPAWLRKLLGDDFFSDVEVVVFPVDPSLILGSGGEVSYDGLVYLQSFVHLQILILRGDSFTDAGLEHLKGLTKLGRLDVESKNITDAGLEHLKGLTDLQSLTLNSNRITDAGLEHVKRLIHLRRSFLTRTHVTDAGLQHLKGLSQLQTLNLEATDVTDAGVARLQQSLPSCEISFWHKNAPFRPNVNSSTPGRRN
jgi:hypothetical protein